jgi:hypothetical protein
VTLTSDSGSESDGDGAVTMMCDKVMAEAGEGKGTAGKGREGRSRP